MDRRIQRYKFEYHNNHPVVLIDGRTFIIDTGSPVSFFVDGHAGVLTINNRSFKLSNNLMHINREGIENLVGLDINGFIGMDILTSMGALYMNKCKGFAWFGNGNYTCFGNIGNLGLKQIMGMKYLEADVAVNGVNTKAIIDSGACISYVSSELIGNSAYLGMVDDYSPSFGGNIYTAKYETEISFCGEDCAAITAKMTKMIENSVGLLGYKVILGFGEIEWSELLIDLVTKKISFS